MVPLRLAERESVFVVFRNQTDAVERHTSRPAPPSVLADLAGEWDVTFPASLGAPAGLRLAQLESWTANPDNGVKFFSGTATYRKTFVIAPAQLRPAGGVIPDLGRVGDRHDRRAGSRRCGRGR